MSKALLLAALLTAASCFPGHGHAPATVELPALALEQPILAPDPPRATTVLALAPPAPLPDLLAPLPAGYTAPANAARPTDGLQTTRLVLGIAAAAVAVLGAVLALK